ncbi:MAG: DUF3685 domain-containing protein [Synechococcus sp.]|nr:DUF3685 domain-containing protein [Synechococcus sp.]
MTKPQRVLLIGSGWAAESLDAYLSEQKRPWSVERQPSPPATALRSDLCCWLLDQLIEPANLSHEVQLLQRHLAGSPLLLVLPSNHRYPRQWLLQLPAEGLLDQPSASEIKAALDVLASGGRVVQLQQQIAAEQEPSAPRQGLGHWLFRSGLEQIERERLQLEQWLQTHGGKGLQAMLIRGRLRELRMARELLGVIWGQPLPARNSAPTAPPTAPQHNDSLSIVLADRRGLTVLNTVEERLAKAVGALDGVEPGTPLLALEALNPTRRRQLFEALLQEFHLLCDGMRDQLCSNGSDAAALLWQGQQAVVRQRALQQLVGAYTELPRDGALVRLADALIETSDLNAEDPELADLLPSLMALVQGRPLLIDGALQAADEPAALLHLQQLMSNWLVRNAELIARQLVNNCSGWPELRRSLLVPELLSTRQLDRQRNRINAHDRWQMLFERPVAIYESRRLLYDIGNGALQLTTVRDLRDKELQQLSWWQQAITLLLETRDALAPQVELLINRLGSLMVLLLTRVLGRAIGLIGRGVLQGLGRGLQNADTVPQRR